MKKLSFLFAMVFAVSMAMGQTAVVNQTTAAGLSATQDANVTQTGNSLVKITQVTNKELSHVATAEQSGGNNNTIIVSQTNEASNGSGINKTAAKQAGYNNVIKQTQTSVNYSYAGMEFIASQIGNGNNAVQESGKENADFDIFQNGTGNDALQRAIGVKTGVLEGDIKQIGNFNKGTQLFHGQQVRNDGGVIDQNGTSNTAKQEFDVNGSIWWDNGSNSPNSRANIVQRSNNNYAYQSQVGQGSYQNAVQTGSTNEIRMWSNGNYNEAYSKQDGNNGDIRINQKQENMGPATESSFDGNHTMVSQNGNGSSANIMQNGLRNEVGGLGETGTFAINNGGANLIINQTGSDNAVWSRQLVGASETVTQTGANNTAIVNQY